jgi:hypothetical protein
MISYVVAEGGVGGMALVSVFGFRGEVILV